MRTPIHPLLRLPEFAVNAIAVALGVAVVHLIVTRMGGAHAGQLALGGAVCASLADVPNTAQRHWRSVLAAAVLGVLAAALVAALQPRPLALGAGVMGIAFVAMMTMAWGPRAGAVSFAPVLALVFAMAVPATGEPILVRAGWNLAGAAAYLAWSVAANALLQRRYRTLALVNTLAAVAELLRERATLIESVRAPARDTQAMQAWIRGEAELADRLQSARDLVFAAPAGARGRRDTAILLRAIDLRDVLLGSRLDLELLSGDAAGRWILQRLTQTLGRFGQALDAAAAALRDGRAAPSTVPSADAGPDPFAQAPMPLPAQHLRLLPALTDRLHEIAAGVARIQTLLRGEHDAAPLSWQQLQRFVSPEGWPLKALQVQWSPDSPVLRHALRTALALGFAYYLALALPWASHPHWLVLSVAVVLRGSIEQTLSRRNGRVAGTVLGCACVLLISHRATPAALEVVFLIAVGTAHAFVLRRYWLTASAATVMALLQSHMFDPAGGFAVAERVADTLLGAALAWAFSYVLPSWERRHLPRLVHGAVAALRDFAVQALTSGQPADSVEQRLARRRAYDAIGALAAAWQRGSAEPASVRLAVPEIAALLDHGQRMMAHLSLVRLTLARRSAVLGMPGARAALQRAGVVLAASLDLKQPLPDAGQAADAGELSRLPPEAPAENILPWLERRLQLLVHDGSQVRNAALQALAAERRTPPAG
jgi:uncharacterized membrane protein YccC